MMMVVMRVVIMIRDVDDCDDNEYVCYDDTINVWDDDGDGDSDVGDVDGDRDHADDVDADGDGDCDSDVCDVDGDCDHGGDCVVDCRWC